MPAINGFAYEFRAGCSDWFRNMPRSMLQQVVDFTFAWMQVEGAIFQAEFHHHDAQSRTHGISKANFPDIEQLLQRFRGRYTETLSSATNAPLRVNQRFTYGLGWKRDPTWRNLAESVLTGHETNDSRIVEGLFHVVYRLRNHWMHGVKFSDPSYEALEPLPMATEFLEAFYAAHVKVHGWP